MTLLLYGVLGWLGVKLAVLLVNWFSFPVLRPQSPAQPKRVSLLVPARNEAHNLAQTLPGFLAQQVAEVLVLDDGSSDATAQTVEQAADPQGRLRLIGGLPKPEGWVGKSWACHQLAQAASGEVLIFVDADVFLAEGATQAVLAQMQRSNVGLFSVFSRQITPSLLERIVLPTVDVFLLTNFPYPVLKAPFAAAGVANGQLMAFTRPAYAACGGHQAVREAVVEDIRLAQRVKAAGETVALALGHRLVGVRMYRSYTELLEGLSKNFIELHLRSRAVLAWAWLAHLLAYTLCWGLGFWQPLWWAVGGLGLLERMLVNLKCGRALWEVVLVPLALPLATPIYWRTGRSQYRWKGREYKR